MDMHMDGAWGTFWIKSQNGTFIALQMKSFGPQKNLQPKLTQTFQGLQFLDHVHIHVDKSE